MIEQMPSFLTNDFWDWFWKNYSTTMKYVSAGIPSAVVSGLKILAMAKTTVPSNTIKELLTDWLTPRFPKGKP